MVRVGALTRHVEVMNSPDHRAAPAADRRSDAARRARGGAQPRNVRRQHRARRSVRGAAGLHPGARSEPRGRKRARPADHSRRTTSSTASTRPRASPTRLLVEVLIPEQKRDHVSVFMELSRRHGDFALAGLACHARFERETVSDVRLVYFGSEAKPTLGHPRDGGDQRASPGRRRPARRRAPRWPMTSIRSTTRSAAPATKLHLQRVLTQRALDTGRGTGDDAMSLEETIQVTMTVNGERVTRDVAGPPAPGRFPAHRARPHRLAYRLRARHLRRLLGAGRRRRRARLPDAGGAGRRRRGGHDRGHHRSRGDRRPAGDVRRRATRCSAATARRAC